MSIVTERFNKLCRKVVGIEKVDFIGDNVLKRILYAEFELFRMDIESNKDFAKSEEGSRMINEIVKHQDTFTLGKKCSISSCLFYM